MGLTSHILILIQLSEDATLVNHTVLQLKQFIVAGSESANKYITDVSKDLKWAVKSTGVETSFLIAIVSAGSIHLLETCEVLYHVHGVGL